MLGTATHVGIRRLVAAGNARCLFLAVGNLRLPSIRASCGWLLGPLLPQCLLRLLRLLLKLVLLLRQQRLLKPLLRVRLCITLLLCLLVLLSRDASAQLAVAAGVHVVPNRITKFLRRWWSQGLQQVGVLDKAGVLSILPTPGKPQQPVQATCPGKPQQPGAGVW